MPVNAPCGPVEGIAREAHTAYLGVPYARAPYPGRAFEAPEPHARFTTCFEATGYGPGPAHPHVGQELFPDPVVTGDEALNLNVYAPSRGDGPFPVVVWLYGGGFFTGGNASPWYDGASFARDGVVLVVPNYRVAAEGFMILDDLVANRALLDVTAALTWVRDNIASFGGDPANVTLAGQSAGATAALALTGAPAARGLFRRLIAMSAGTPLLTPLERMTRLSADFAGQLGVPRTRQALSAAPTARRMELEHAWLPGEVQAPPESVDDRARQAGRDALRWQPTLDGAVVTTAPEEALSEPGALDALLIGTTTQEWNFLLGDLTTAPSTDACVTGMANLGLTSGDLDTYLGRLGSRNPGHALAQALSDHTFRRPARRIADTAARAGITTYAYQSAWPAPGFGAAHCSDLPFVFDHLDAPRAPELLGPDAPRHLAGRMHTALVRFAHDGDPGWSAYTAEERRTMVFDRDSHECADGLARTPDELADPAA
ncbi:putative carboxylesterase [Actinacidiphila reveromycinica]|uniref:Carboxylic ester hydrolase n=1 Tax=Actinacidiphila reveromycinica TaxID=659352 RepID=A0A7U3VS50_9ACTN|nr:carboxylesterase family protein [Streptomyces sp. SN-593]BBB01375.1 putative carboxylesterase [Streptomyces sp. SN-593]